MNKNFDPSEIETKWYKFWEESGFFEAKPESNKDTFCIMIPPPNVTGTLHMGHGFQNALIDTLLRFKRMNGYDALWQVGTDHAGIATQMVVERQLESEGITKEDLGREEFIKRVWDWKESSGNTITKQIRRLGSSVDWSREAFTMSPDMSQAVLEVFIKLYKEGLIYQGERLVNWDVELQTTLSDLEVDNTEENGSLWHLKYQITNESKYLIVATTRPETMLGDTAVAVNPEDDRYKKYIGKSITLPITNRQVPIIADEYVDEEFGTGCVKITPAHDFNDFEIGKRLGLEIINILNKDGTLNENAGKFRNMDRFDARKRIIQDLDDLGLLTKVEEYSHTVPFSDRGKVPIEPLLSTQWFLKIDGISLSCLNKLDANQPKFIPFRWQKVYKDWLININDWCISRQLWWGHQIPAWYVLNKNETRIKQDTPYIVAHNEDEALKLAYAKYGLDINIVRDKDVLDTWVSSGLWPFSTLGWPNKLDQDFQKWYPNSLLVTGFDIIFFWVARMTMMGNIFTNQIPFTDVYIHGLVRDENNKKMSKSAGNGIDPLLLIDKYGSDALRFALIREVAGAGQDIRIDFNRKNQTSSTVEASRNFANKLWNATKFALLNIDVQNGLSKKPFQKNNLYLSDRWILSRLNQVKDGMTELLDSYKLGEAAKLIYEFAWNDFCDWYVEFLKPRFNDSSRKNEETSEIILIHVLNEILIMMNPFMPHITEVLWHALNNKPSNELLSLEPWPEIQKQFLDITIEKSFNKFFEVIRLIRNLRIELGLKPSIHSSVYLVSSNEDTLNFLKLLIVDIKNLTKTSEVIIVLENDFNKDGFSKSFSGIVGDLEVYIPFEGLINIDNLRERINRDLEKVNIEIINLNKRLANKSFIEKAPKAVVEDCKNNLKEAKSKFNIITKKLEMLQ